MTSGEKPRESTTVCASGYVLPAMSLRPPPEPYEKAYGILGGVTRKQVLVQLDDELVAALDLQAETSGISRSQLIRNAIAAHLRDLEWEEADRAAIEAYRRVPEDARELPALERLAIEVLGDATRDET